MTSVFNIPFVVRIHVNLLQQYIIETSLENTVSTNNSNLHFLGFLVFPKLISAVNFFSYLICAVHLELSHQLVRHLKYECIGSGLRLRLFLPFRPKKAFYAAHFLCSVATLLTFNSKLSVGVFLCFSVLADIQGLRGAL